MPLRDYQVDAVESAMGSSNGILVLPTGSGKSHVIAGIADRIEGKVIVLQPTKEILESNLDKIKHTGIESVGVFSASMNEKTLGKVTYATIGSIIKIQKRLTDVDTGLQSDRLTYQGIKSR
jgi:DNA repair protein RadD